MTNDPTMQPIEGDAGIAPIAVPSNASPVFDVRNFGWENISMPVPNDVEQALIAAKLNWQVLPRPISIDGAIIKGRIGNVRSDKPPGENFLEVVGSKYKIVQNHEALGFVQDVLNAGTVKIERAGSFEGGKTVFLLASTKGLVVDGDRLEPYVLFSNSHDGSSSVKVCLTAIRVSCRNTLALALKAAPRIWSVPHTKSAMERMKAAQASMNFIGTYLTVMPMFIERMIETEINEVKFEKIAASLFPIPVKTERNERSVDNAIDARNNFELIYNETHDLDKIRGTAWGVYNAYSDYVSHKTAGRETENYEANRFITNITGKNLERAQNTIMAMAV